MALYVALGIIGGFAILWLAGYVLSALLDAGRPREVDSLPHLFEGDRLRIVQRLIKEWEGERHHWVEEDHPDPGSRAA